MFEVGVVVEFEASHHLVGDFGPATQEHSHRYRVECAARGRSLGPSGTLLDIANLEGSARQVADELEGQSLNGLTAFQGLNPTAEIVAQHFFKQLAGALSEGPDVLVVRVWESSAAYASYEDVLRDPPTSGP